jgi:hypothetical protein
VSVAYIGRPGDNVGVLAKVYEPCCVGTTLANSENANAPGAHCEGVLCRTFLGK